MIPDILAVGDLMRAVAASEVLTRFRNLKPDQINEKDFGELVTVADLRAEEILERELRALVPGSKVIGEEMVSRDISILDAHSTTDPLWIIDPIDGTQNFADGKSCFAMIIAYVHKGETLAGWIHEPYTNALVWAAKGQGAWEKGIRLQITNRTDVSEFRGSLNKSARERLNRRQIEENLEIPKDMTRYHCVGAEYADLARGNLQFAHYMGNIKPWDHAAGILIHSEAGGYSGYSDSGKPYFPIPPHRDRAIIIAPGSAAWARLRDLTAI